METPTNSKPFKDKTFSLLISLLLLDIIPAPPALGDSSPHVPRQLTWQVFSQAGEVVWSTTGTYPLHTWWPTLNPDLCQLTLGAPWPWDLEGYYDTSQPPNQPSPRGRLGLDPWGGCSTSDRRAMLSTLAFYVCPGFHRQRSLDPTCGGGEYFYCKNWGCETTGDTYWGPTSSWDYITVKANYSHPEFPKWKELRDGACKGWCHPLQIQFTEPGKKATGWVSGYSWGLRLYKERGDDGILFKIKLKIEDPRQPIGPNPVLSDQQKPVQNQRSPNIVLPLVSNSTPALATASLASPPPTHPGTGDRLLNLIKRSLPGPKFL